MYPNITNFPKNHLNTFIEQIVDTYSDTIVIRIEIGFSFNDIDKKQNVFVEFNFMDLLEDIWIYTGSN